MEHQTDDSPLYIFDSHFDDDEVAKGLLEDFSVPSYFPDDLFSLVGERRRPPYRSATSLGEALAGWFYWANCRGPS